MACKVMSHGSVHSYPLGRCLGVASRAAPGSPPQSGCSPLATRCGAEPAFSTQCLNPLLAVPGGQRVWQAMSHICAASVDVPVQASQHRTPWAVSWEFWMPAHQQCPIIDCPHEVLDGCRSHSAGTGHLAHLSSLIHATIAAWRGTEFCKLQ